MFSLLRTVSDINPFWDLRYYFTKVNISTKQKARARIEGNFILLLLLFLYDMLFKLGEKLFCEAGYGGVNINLACGDEGDCAVI